MTAVPWDDGAAMTESRHADAIYDRGSWSHIESEGLIELNRNEHGEITGVTTNVHEQWAGLVLPKGISPCRAQYSEATSRRVQPEMTIVALRHSERACFNIKSRLRILRSRMTDHPILAPIGEVTRSTGKPTTYWRHVASWAPGSAVR